MDGTKEITLGPIHSSIGKQKLRIVAYAMDKPMAFKAVVQPLDLSGDWLVYSTGASGGNIQCDDDEGESGETDYNETAMFTSVYTSLPAAVTGVFTADNGQTGYTWTMSPGADMTFGEDVALEINGSALIAKEGVRLQTKLTIPRKETNLSNTIPMLSGIGFVSLAALFCLYKKTKVIFSAAVDWGIDFNDRLCRWIWRYVWFACRGYYLHSIGSWRRPDCTVNRSILTGVFFR